MGNTGSYAAGTASGMSDYATEKVTGRSRGWTETATRVVVSQHPIGAVANTVVNVGEMTGGYGRQAQFDQVYEAAREGGLSHRAAQEAAYECVNSDSTAY